MTMNIRNVTRYVCADIQLTESMEAYNNQEVFLANKKINVTRFAKAFHLRTTWQEQFSLSVDSSTNKLFTSTP